VNAFMQVHTNCKRTSPWHRLLPTCAAWPDDLRQRPSPVSIDNDSVVVNYHRPRALHGQLPTACAADTRCRVERPGLQPAWSIEVSSLEGLCKFWGTFGATPLRYYPASSFLYSCYVNHPNSTFHLLSLAFTCFHFAFSGCQFYAL